MSSDTLILAFPFVPLVALGAALIAQALLRRDITYGVIGLNHAVQLALGVGLWMRFRSFSGVHRVVLSGLPYAIEFAFDAHRLCFLAAYLAPLGFSLFRLRCLETQVTRNVLLFFLAGTSGLLVAGDVFNFYVFYEMMIMSAYVLIASRGVFYASVKYMVFNAVSSMLFLAGIITLYSTGARFGFDFGETAGGWDPRSRLWVFTLFTSAFLVKAAFFPASCWLAGCHSAAQGAVSAFLGSITVFTGVFGLHYLVLEPAAVLGVAAPFALLRLFSWASLSIAALFMFFEPEWKRVVAGSTLWTLGFVGLLLSVRESGLALTTMAVHAIYKSAMFYLVDELDIRGLEVYARRRVLAAVWIGVLFVLGVFPTAGYFLKLPLFDGLAGARVAFPVLLFLAAGAFLKFRFHTGRYTGPGILWTLPAGMALAVFMGYGIRFRLAGYAGIALDMAVLVLAVLCAPRLFQRLRRWERLDRRIVYGNMNRELLFVLVLLGMVLCFYWGHL